MAIEVRLAKDILLHRENDKTVPEGDSYSSAAPASIERKGTALISGAAEDPERVRRPGFAGSVSSRSMGRYVYLRQ